MTAQARLPQAGTTVAGAWAMQRAIWRALWHPQRGTPWWSRRWLPPLLLMLSIGGLAMASPSMAPAWLAIAGLIVTGWYGWIVVDGLLRQNQPALARLLPGHVAALRSALLLHGALAAVAALAVLTATVGQPFGSPWAPLWWIVPALVFIVWVQREPWLWLLTAGVGLVPWPRVAGWAAAQPPALQALGLLAAALAIAAAIGQGGALHRRYDERARRWRRAARAGVDGRTPPVVRSTVLRRLLALLQWPERVWRRRVLALGVASPLPARLELGLGLGGQWAALLWAATLLFGALFAALVIVDHGQPERTLAEWIDHGRFGLVIGAFALANGLLHERLTRLWRNRREQVLMALLPGVHAASLAQLEARWLRTHALAWAIATVFVLTVTAFGSADSRSFALLAAACSMPLGVLAQRCQRRIRGRPGTFVFAATAPLAAALAQLGVVFAVPAWLGVGLAALATVLLLRPDGAGPVRLPVGRGAARG